MAIAWAVTINKVTVFGDQRISYCTLVSPASCSYTTGGDSITPAQVGLDVIDFANLNLAIVTSGMTTAYAVNFTPGTGSAAGKLQLFTTTAATAPLAELGSSSSAAESYTIVGEFRGV
jgi:hypothetical protein